MRLIYLAGPIRNCSDGEMQEWRTIASMYIQSKGHRAIDPAVRDYRHQAYTPALSAEIVRSDLADIAMCDVILAAMWRESAGTCMEVWHASQTLQMPVVVWGNDLSPWVVYCARAIHDDLQDALEAVCNLP